MIILKTPVGTKIKFDCDKDNDLWITIKEMQQLVIDRSQAHLLMLYLQEHLSGSQVSDGLDKAIDDELKHKPKDIME